jgi:hypothetical protein
MEYSPKHNFQNIKKIIETNKMSKHNKFIRTHETKTKTET